MASIDTEQRNALLDLARARSKQTSFTKQLTPGPTIVKVVRQQQTIIKELKSTGTLTSIDPVKLPPASINALLPKGSGFHPNGFYFDMRMDFALGPQGHNGPGGGPSNTPDPPLDPDEYEDWGRHYSNPMQKVGKDTVYIVRLTLTQPRVEPLMGGFIIHWIRPRNWSWVDGQSTDTPIQVVSNPMVVLRLVLSPATTLVRSGFTARVKAFYP